MPIQDEEDTNIRNGNGGDYILPRSSKRQKDQGSGLDSQEHRCREYAAARGLNVEAVFPDDISGGGDFMKRPGMVALLAYLSAQVDKRYVVIFDDLKRFARDTEFHIKLRRELANRNATVECLNFKFERLKASSSRPSWPRKANWSANKTVGKLSKK